MRLQCYYMLLVWHAKLKIPGSAVESTPIAWRERNGQFKVLLKRTSAEYLGRRRNLQSNCCAVSQSHHNRWRYMLNLVTVEVAKRENQTWFVITISIKIRIFFKEMSNFSLAQSMTLLTHDLGYKKIRMCGNYDI